MRTQNRDKWPHQDRCFFCAGFSLWFKSNQLELRLETTDFPVESVDKEQVLLCL